MAAIFDVPLMRTQQKRNSCSAQIFLENKMDRVQKMTSLVGPIVPRNTSKTLTLNPRSSAAVGACRCPRSASLATEHPPQR